MFIFSKKVFFDRIVNLGGVARADKLQSVGDDLSNFECVNA